MKKLLLFLPVFGLGLVSIAQTALKDNKLQRLMQDRPVVMQQNQPATPTHSAPQHRSGSRELETKLFSQRIGSAGNLLTIIDGGCNQIDANDALNTITFVHRVDPTETTGNIAQYAYDYSTNGGTTWNTNLGPITVNGAIDNDAVCGRFPQAVIYNPTGNTTAANAYLVYSGTWHDNVTWTGQMRGKGQLGNVNSYNVAFPTLNGGKNAIGTGMVQSQPGTFFLVNQSSTQSFVGTADVITDGIVLSKGVWNSGTNNVDWTDVVLPATFQTQDQDGRAVSVVTALDIAFDPTGQIGWISALGDITAGDDSAYQPIFWKSTDAGATWSAPIQINLTDLQGVVENLPQFLLDGETPTTGLPTTAFEAALTVDFNGNPHLLTSVGTGSEYSIQTAGYTMYDITYDTSSIAGCDWKAIYMNDILALRGTMTSDNPAQTMDNRPLVSRTADGKKVFFFWTDTDIFFLGTPDNDLPNLFGKAIDVEAQTITDLYNFTEGDTLWSGETEATPGSGVFGGAKFPMVSSTARVVGATYNVPLVLTQVDYNNDPEGGSLGSSEEPAAFWYISNIDFPAAAFDAPLDQTPPVVTLLGEDTVLVPLGTTYTEDSATAFDCSLGDIVPVITNSPNVNVQGTYNVTYTATDASGNATSVIRTVIVGTAPVADFVWNFPTIPNRPQFTDSSANNPNRWSWTFGDGGGSIQRNPARTYIAPGTYNVCLTATNDFGSSTPVCQDVFISAVGINDIEFANQVNVFPNPANNKVFIQIQSDVTEQMTVSLINLLGEEVTAPLTYKAGTTNMEISTANVANGLYVVRIQTAKSAAVKTISVNHN